MKNVKTILLYLAIFFSISILIYCLTISIKNNASIKRLHIQDKYIIKLLSQGVENMPKAYGELREKQKMATETLIKFDKFAKKNGIKYWINYGTLLGAYRHGGFIPWDDDIDIGMTEDNLKKLTKLLENSDYGLKLSPQYGNSKGTLCFASEDGKGFDIFNHVCLTNDNYGKLSKFLKWTRLFRTKYFQDKKYSYFDDLKTDCNSSSDLIITERSISIRGITGISKKYFKISDIYPLKTATFEGYEFPVPANTEKVLELFYGSSFMDLPNDFGYSSHLSKWN